MTEDEARKHAQRMIDTWPAGPKAYVWRDLFLPLDSAIAHGAYHALVRDAIKTPTPGQLMAQYNALLPRPEPRGIVWQGNEISLGEYLEQLTARSLRGDQDATDELDNWNRWLTPKEAS